MSFPDSASSWTVNNLNAINVTYAKNHTRLKIFTDRVKRLSSNLDTLYGERKILIGNNTREYWDFTVKITENQTSEIKEIKEIKEALRRLNDATQNGSSESQRLFDRWRTNLTEFLNGLHMVILRPPDLRPPDLRPDDRREAVYMQLFMAFSRIFFLYPELGEMYLRKCNIGSKSVTGLPDVCFETLPNLANSTSTESGNVSTESENSSTVSEISSSTTSTESIPKLILVTEVKRDGLVRQWSPGIAFKIEHLLSNVKGQHGLELLLEIERRSLFEREVFGCICVKTYIIITRLKLTKNDLANLRENGNIPGNGAKITYSKPYDFLEKKHREKILDFFILIGCVQSNT